MGPASRVGARNIAAALTWIAAFACPLPGLAQAPPDRAATAQALYEAAAELLKSGNYKAACPKLEESLRLDPAMGTQFFLATCYESTGRPTSAWSLFLEVAAAAKAAGNSVRESTARGRATALEPQLPRIVVAVDAKAAALPGFEVTRDGVPLKPIVWGTAVPVDLGAHLVRAGAPGKVPWETTVRIEAMGARAEVQIPMLADEPPKPPPVMPRATPIVPVAAPESPPSPPRGLGPQRIAAIASGGVGGAALVAGSVLGAMAKSTWSDAQAACPARRACSKEAHDQSLAAISFGTGSTVSFVIGGAAVAGALALWLTAPSQKPAVRVTPIAGPGAFGFSAGGAF